MGVVNVKSGVITNRDASPSVLNNGAASGGVLRSAVGTVEVTSGDSIASIYRLCSVPSNARVSSVKIYSDDLGTTTLADIGLYRTTADGSAVVDADFFGSAVSLKDGVLAGSDVTHESGAFDAAEAEQMIWQANGASSDPMVQYDVCATLTAACDGTGTLTVKIDYAV